MRKLNFNMRNYNLFFLLSNIIRIPDSNLFSAKVETKNSATSSASKNSY
jgi:hypothetical protein